MSNLPSPPLVRKELGSGHALGGGRGRIRREGGGAGWNVVKVEVERCALSCEGGRGGRSGDGEPELDRRRAMPVIDGRRRKVEGLPLAQVIDGCKEAGELG